jgi:hypothetical protein
MGIKFSGGGTGGFSGKWATSARPIFGALAPAAKISGNSIQGNRHCTLVWSYLLCVSAPLRAFCLEKLAEEKTRAEAQSKGGVGQFVISELESHEPFLHHGTLAAAAEVAESAGLAEVAGASILARRSSQRFQESSAAFLLAALVLSIWPMRMKPWAAPG